MKLPISWLNEYVNTEGLSPADLTRELTMSGSKVEGFEDLRQGIENIVTGQILSVEKHPNADKLNVCAVNAGGEAPIQIITAAQNVFAGAFVPVALHKSTLADGTKITKGNLRGLPSDGMFCSHAELGLTKHFIPYAAEDGILILEGEPKPGTDIGEVLGLNEVVLEFEITSNRPDCLSVTGLARETAATFNRPLTVNAPTVIEGSGDITKMLSIKVENPALCPRYTARVCTDIEIKPSPAWLRERLHAAGIRPINNIVDITNYVMLEYGQPMHAFDYSTLHDGKIVVRTATEGEIITTLDGQEHKLTAAALVIADDQKPIAVAGVMGGMNTEITEKTNTIVFESANFNGPSVRRTAKYIGNRTDASSRYEKGLDAQLTDPSVERACQLVEELGAGKVVKGKIDVNNADSTPKTIALDAAEINAFLGTDITKETMCEYLTRLGFTAFGDTLTIPSFRNDIERMCDVAEEVARIFGYGNIPASHFGGGLIRSGLSEVQIFEKTVNELARALGFSEIITYSFISPKFYDGINLAEDSSLRTSTTIQNPLGEDTSLMRTTALPSLLNTLRLNQNHRNMAARVYELAKTYHPVLQDGAVKEAELPEEKKVLLFGAYGAEESFFTLKGCIEAFFAEVNMTGVTYEATEENTAYHKTQTANILHNGKNIGIIGKISPKVCKAFELDIPAFAAELDIAYIYANREAAPLYTPLPKFPAVTRDIALLCGDQVPVGKLMEVIEKKGGKILEAVDLFDVYKGAQIAENQKSVAFALTFRDKEKTLTDDDINPAMTAILAALEEMYGAVLRS